MQQMHRAGQRAAGRSGAVRPSLHQRRLIKAAASERMVAADRVQLGDSDLQVSIACLGTMTYGRQNTEAEAHEQLSYATDMGINFVDTAEMYPIPTEASTQGRTDQYIGTWLKGHKRDSIVLATKVSGYSDRITWVRNPPRPTRVERSQILESVEASLKRLQTDHIDLLQIHWPERYVPLFGSSFYDVKNVYPATPIEEQLRAFEEVIKSGKVRYIGVSNETSYGVCEFAHLAKTAGLPKIQTIQNSYSLLVRAGYETNLSETCHEHKVSLLAYSPLAGGSLTNKYNDGTAKGTCRLNLFPGYMARYNESTVKQAVAEYAEVAKKYGLTPTELALAWCKSRWFVASSIFGATTMDQLKHNIAAFNKDLPDECITDIAAVFKRYRDPTIM